MKKIFSNLMIVFAIIMVVILVIILGTLLFIIQTIRKPYRKEDLSKYLKSVLIGLDQFGGTLIYGTEDWCISSMAYAHSLDGKNIWFMMLINKLFFFDKDHCKRSYEMELAEFNEHYNKQ